MNIHYYLASRLLVLLIFVAPVLGQNTMKAVEIPAKYVSIVLISDPASPIGLLDPKVIKYENGGIERVFSIRNQTKRGILSFKIKQVSWYGNAGSTLSSESLSKESFRPDTILSTISVKRDLEILPATESNLANLEFDVPANKMIWIVAVTEVKLSNGETYSTEKKWAKLERFIANLGVEIDTPVNITETRETALREFIEKTFNFH